MGVKCQCLQDKLVFPEHFEMRNLKIRKAKWKFAYQKKKKKKKAERVKKEKNYMFGLSEENLEKLF